MAVATCIFGKTVEYLLGSIKSPRACGLPNRLIGKAELTAQVAADFGGAGRTPVKTEGTSQLRVLSAVAINHYLLHGRAQLNGAVARITCYYGHTAPHSVYP